MISISPLSRTRVHLLYSFCYQVQRLNRTDVGAQERVIAERFYLAQYSGAWWEAKEANSPDAMAAFEAEHPTFRDLITAHGEPDRPKAAVVRL